MYNGALEDMRLTLDPWNMNRYAFAGGNPVSFVEFDGHIPILGSDTRDPMGDYIYATGRTYTPKGPGRKVSRERWASEYLERHFNESIPWSPRSFKVAKYMEYEIQNNPSSFVGQMILINNRIFAASPGTSQKFVHKTAAYALWVYMVRAGGRWDHKEVIMGMLGKAPNTEYPYHAPISKYVKYEFGHDSYSNIHYAIVGRALGFSEKELWWGANAGELAEKHFGKGVGRFVKRFTGVNNQSDNIHVEIGFDLFDRYGTNVTASQILSAILQRRGDYLKYKEDGFIIRWDDGY